MFQLTQLAGLTLCHAGANLEPCRTEVWDLPKVYLLVLHVLLCQICQRFVQSTTGTSYSGEECGFLTSAVAGST